jgi:hypothetical protein
LKIYLEATGNDRHSNFSDPRFVDPGRNDFHLQANSRALTTGTTEEIPVGNLDLEGSPRVKSGKIDIGCYQQH